MPKIIVVFDIDDCIASGFEEDAATVVAKYPWVTVFKKNGLYLEAIQPHILHPGIIEFIQLLNQMPNAEIHFFSTGIAERNHSLVAQLLERALGKERYELTRHQIRICSRNDLSDCKVDEVNKLFKEFGIFKGQKKNLKKLNINKEAFPWTVRIDDDLAYVKFKQIKTALKIPAAWSNHFGYMYASFLNHEERHKDDYYRVNHIFYAVGMFYSALEIAQKNPEKTLADAIFEIQFKKEEKKSSFIPDKFKHFCISQDPLHFHYYQYGLEKLREINPQLHFMDHEHFLDQAHSSLELKHGVKTLLNA